ncbi:MAG: chemotaxis response regulator protein-glutamate methylesterase [Lachnospiraceae bacterium]|nr:chemotaxis response regulator protein-glutamate methylesterase [Lachnospiraceae bacterium]
MFMNKIKIMVVDDSIMFRTWLINNLSRESRFEIIGYAVNAMDAMNKIPLLKPDVMTLDIEMPGMTGLEFLKQMLPKHPIPVVLVSSLNVRVFDALAAGAVDFVRKPDDENHISRDMVLSTLISKIKIASQAHVHLPTAEGFTIANGTVTRKTASRPTFSGQAAMPLPSGIPGASASGRYPGVLSSKGASITEDMVLAIGASTGGTEAILAVMRQFPAKMPGIVITQHMPAGFTSMYAERLNRLCQMEVREAKHGDRLTPGLALLAPGGIQMRLVRMGSGYSVSCVGTDKVSGHCPSVDVLFDSVANVAKSKAIGVILTGMGADGAAGLLRMRKNGAYTIGQDQESCVVYGMPMEAYKIGAVCTQTSLEAIPSAVMARLSQPNQKL